MATLTVGLWNSSEFKKVKLENVDLGTDVLNFKTEAFKVLDETKPLELMYCGVILEDNSTLSSYGLESGSILHAIQKLEEKQQPQLKPPTAFEVRELISIFTNFANTSGYRTVLQRILTKDVLQDLMKNTPGLSADPATLAIIKDPELISHLAEPEFIEELPKKNPILLAAAFHLAKIIQADGKQNLALSDPDQAGPSSGYSYSLAALSDDDDMDTSYTPLSRNSSYSTITQAQLAAAIANATGSSSSNNSAPVTPNSAPVISNEMFRNAIQQAFTSALAGGSQNPLQMSGEEETMENIITGLQPQLQQMREMGLVNEGLNVRALQATSGDVQAAIELVFNGVIE